MDEIYLFIDGVQQGPFTPEATHQSLREGFIPPDLLAWKNGMTEWKPVGDLFLHGRQTSSPMQTSDSGGAEVTKPRPRLRARMAFYSILLLGLVIGCIWIGHEQVSGEPIGTDLLVSFVQKVSAQNLTNKTFVLPAAPQKAAKATDSIPTTLSLILKTAGSDPALASLQQAAQQGYASAEASLGVRYQHGEGVARDLTKAIYWIEKAAHDGDANAQMILGGEYAGCDVDPATSLNLPKDWSQAKFWLQKAAEQGQDGAQYLLGIMYRDGEGVPADAGQAKAWFKKAADQGNQDAAAGLQALNLAASPLIRIFGQMPEQLVAGRRYDIQFVCLQQCSDTYIIGDLLPTDTANELNITLFNFGPAAMKMLLSDATTAVAADPIPMVLKPDNLKIFQSINLPRDTLMSLVATFDSYTTVTMENGAQERLPVFTVQRLLLIGSTSPIISFEDK